MKEWRGLEEFERKHQIIEIDICQFKLEFNSELKTKEEGEYDKAEEIEKGGGKEKWVRWSINKKEEWKNSKLKNKNKHRDFSLLFKYVNGKRKVIANKENKKKESAGGGIVKAENNEGSEKLAREEKSLESMAMNIVNKYPKKSW